MKPPELLEIAFDGGDFSGLWIGRFETAAQATRVHFTETLTLPSPFVRLLAHAGLPMGAAPQTYQQDLKAFVETRRRSV